MVIPVTLGSFQCSVNFISSGFRYVLGKFGITQDVFMFSRGQMAHEKYVSFPGPEVMRLV